MSASTLACVLIFISRLITCMLICIKDLDLLGKFKASLLELMITYRSLNVNSDEVISYVINSLHSNEVILLVKALCAL